MSGTPAPEPDLSHMIRSNRLAKITSLGRLAHMVHIAGRQLKGLNTQMETLKAELNAVTESPTIHNRVAHLTPKAAKPARPKPNPVVEALRTKVHEATFKPRQLTAEEIEEIKLLLTKTRVSVLAIAKTYGVSGPTIYGVRDRFGLKVRRGHPALLAGVRRAQAHRKPAPDAPVEAPQAAPVTPAPVAQPTPVSEMAQA